MMQNDTTGHLAVWRSCLGRADCTRGQSALPSNLETMGDTNYNGPTPRSDRRNKHSTRWVEIASQGFGGWVAGLASEKASSCVLKRPACCSTIGCRFLLEPIGEGYRPPREPPPQQSVQFGQKAAVLKPVPAPKPHHRHLQTDSSHAITMPHRRQLSIATAQS